MSKEHLQIESNVDLFSDYTPIVAAIMPKPTEKPQTPRFVNKTRDWELFTQIPEEHVNLKISLKSSQDIELAIETFTKHIQEAAWKLTMQNNKYKRVQDKCPVIIRTNILKKRNLRKKWQQTKNLEDKRNLNRKQ